VDDYDLTSMPLPQIQQHRHRYLGACDRGTIEMPLDLNMMNR